MTMFKDYYVDLPGMNEFSAKQTNIPVGWWIDKGTRNYIVESIKTIQGN